MPEQEPLTALAFTTLDPGEAYVLHSRSGSRHLICCLRNGSQVAARITAGGRVTTRSLSYAHGTEIGPNYLGEPALITSGPVRVGQRARLYTHGDGWWTSASVEAITVHVSIEDREAFEAAVDAIVLAAHEAFVVVAHEAEGWAITLPGLPIVADGATLDEALNEAVAALRAYAEASNERLHEASHQERARTLAARVQASSDNDLRAWLTAEGDDA